jgi:hypothetical protein
MTASTPARLFADPAPADSIERAATALAEHGFAAEILDHAAAARTRVRELIPEGASVLTAASETLRLSGIEEDINESGRYEAIRPRARAMDRTAQADDIRRLIATPDVVLGSVAAVTEAGSLVAASGSGSQLPAYGGGLAVTFVSPIEGAEQIARAWIEIAFLARSLTYPSGIPMVIHHTDLV